MDASQPENRKCNCYRLPIDVDAVIGDKVIQSTARDLCSNGLFIATRTQVLVGEDVRIVFSLPSLERPIKLRGKTVRVEPDGVAVHFQGLSPYFIEILEEAIHQTEVSHQ